MGTILDAPVPADSHRGYKKRYTFRYGCGYDKSCSDSGSE